jgi:glycerol-3-phosphate dehydrogenase
VELTGQRRRNSEFAHEADFDVAIIGGGVNGAALYGELARRGYRVLLIDRSDFGTGTSQASGMMVWGGLLYLRNLDLSTVRKLSRARDAMIRDLPEYVSPTAFRFVRSRRAGTNPLLLRAALLFYWALGGFSRQLPTREVDFPERTLIDAARHGSSYRYEEALLTVSDCRFVLDRITSSQPPDHCALNHCELAHVSFAPAAACWQLDLRDLLTDQQLVARAQLVVNAAGVWTDGLNAQWGIESPYKHVLSKGVYIGIPRPAEQEVPLIFDMEEHGDTITLVPWGPISLWGPTETYERDLDGAFQPTAEDVRFLLDQANRHLKQTVEPNDILCLRCGVRPLAVDSSFSSERYPLELSRRSCFHRDGARPWISLYGGKITGCIEFARSVAREIGRSVPASGQPSNSPPPRPASESVGLFGMDRLPPPSWCAEHEFCCTLDDYLRRRTNIAQWVARGGLGRTDEHVGVIADVARQLYGDGEAAASAVETYRKRVAVEFDAVIAAV